VNLRLGTLDWVVVGGYMALMLGVGAWVGTKMRRFKDYFMAGGALTTPLLICALVSTYYELDVTIATSERGFYSGLVAWTWESRPYYLAIIMAALLLPGVIRKRGGMTLPDILEQSYGKGARVTGAMACFVYSLPITAMAGLSAMFQSLGWDPMPGVLASAGICALYTAGGGLLADSLTDTIQFVFMSVSIAIAVPLALSQVGGFSALSVLPPAHLTSGGGVSPWLILAFTASALTVFVEPVFYQRILAARSVRDIRIALLVGILLWASYDWAVTLIGMLARAAVVKGILPAGLEGSQALVSVCLLALPVGLKGLFVAGVLAAAMSSVDSYSLLAAGNLTYDIIRPLFAPRMADRTLVLLTRIGVFAVMGIGVVISLAFQRVSDAWVFMSSVLVAVVFVPVIGSFVMKPRRAAGLAASAGGLAALGAFYAALYAFGSLDPVEESMVLRIGGAQIWREYAVLFALPVSALSFLAGHLLGRKQ
jgi:SSS family solute:Na+ symporter